MLINSKVNLDFLKLALALKFSFYADLEGLADILTCKLFLVLWIIAFCFIGVLFIVD